MLVTLAPAAHTDARWSVVCWYADDRVETAREDLCLEEELVVRFAYAQFIHVIAIAMYAPGVVTP